MTTADFFDQSMNKSFQEEIEFSAFISGMKSVLQTNIFARCVNNDKSSSQRRDMIVLDLECRDLSILISDETQENRFIMGQLKLDVPNLVIAHFRQGMQLSQPEMTGYCKYLSAALNENTLRVSREPVGRKAEVLRLHLEYNVSGNIESGFLDVPIIQYNLEPEVFKLILATSRALIWQNPASPSTLSSKLLHGQAPFVSASQGAAFHSAYVEPKTQTNKPTASKAKSSSSKAYKKIAGGTSIFVGGGNHFHGIGVKKR